MLGDKNLVANIAVKDPDTARRFYQDTLGRMPVDSYDMPGVTHDGDIHRAGAMNVAGFKDPDGNILNLVNH